MSASRRAQDPVGPERHKQTEWHIAWREGWALDVRLAVRDLRRYRLFAVTALSALALGMALNVTVYTGLDAMLFRGLPLAVGCNHMIWDHPYPD